MTNKVQTPETDIMVETKGKLETFFDNYGNKVLKALVVITLVAVAIFVVVGIMNNNTEKKEHAAQAALTVALTTEAEVEAYVAIANDYAGTKAANTATYMAGAEYLKAGDLENAKTYLAKYENAEGAAGEVINALVLTLRGDIAVEENDLQSAAELFNAAIAASNDIATCETNTHKLALVYRAMGNNEKATEAYKALVKNFPELTTSYAKYIAE
ncbi:MAG: tetratricopeptide repeat protein [Alistipes sp.]|nr:tetratricopeptide repeat protein [Alistipes sp.]